MPLTVVPKTQPFIRRAKFRSLGITVKADESAPQPLCVFIAPGQHHTHQAAPSPGSAHGDPVHVNASHDSNPLERGTLHPIRRGAARRTQVLVVFRCSWNAHGTDGERSAEPESGDFWLCGLARPPYFIHTSAPGSPVAISERVSGRFRHAGRHQVNAADPLRREDDDDHARLVDAARTHEREDLVRRQ